MSSSEESSQSSFTENDASSDSFELSETEDDAIVSIDIYRDLKTYYFATGSINNYVYLYRYENMENPLNRKTNETVTDVKFNAGGTFLAAGCLNGEVYILNGPQNPNPLFDLHHLVKTENGDLEWLAWDPNNDNRLVIPSNNINLQMWDVEEKICIQVFYGFGDIIFCGAFLHEGASICAGSAEGDIKIFDSNSSRLLFENSAPDDCVICITSHHSKPLLAVSYNSGLIKLLHSTKYTLLATFDGHKRSVEHLKFAPDTLDNRVYLASASTDGTACVWDCTSHKRRAEFRTELSKKDSCVVQVSWVELDNLYLVTASTDGLINVWDFNSKVLVQTFFFHNIMTMKELDGLIAIGFTDGSFLVKNLHSEFNSIS